jgi:hypothetical protein
VLSGIVIGAALTMLFRINRKHKTKLTSSGILSDRNE